MVNQVTNETNLELERGLNTLRNYLQHAVELEHATIPPYLSALYTIKPDTNPECASIIRSVLMEEMLHMTLVSNVLNAVGGSPAINHPEFVPNYPTTLPNIVEGPTVHLMPFTPEAIEIFKQIELPEEPETVQAQSQLIRPGDAYPSIGALYHAIERDLRALVERFGEENVFCGDVEKQVTPEMFYGAGGAAITVTDLKSAIQALDEIVDQGEGAPSEGEIFDQDGVVAHYYRFDQILKGQFYRQGDSAEGGPTGETFEVDWNSVYNMAEDPKTVDYPVGSEVREASEAFNKLYSKLLSQLHEAFNGNPVVLRQAVGSMMQLKYKSLELFKTPYPDKPGFQAGPTFELVNLK